MGEIDHECTASAQRGRGRCVIYSVAIESWQLPCQNVFSCGGYLSGLGARDLQTSSTS